MKKKIATIINDETSDTVTRVVKKEVNILQQKKTKKKHLSMAKTKR